MLKPAVPENIIKSKVAKRGSMRAWSDDEDSPIKPQADESSVEIGEEPKKERTRDKQKSRRRQRGPAALLAASAASAAASAGGTTNKNDASHGVEVSDDEFVDAVEDEFEDAKSDHLDESPTSTPKVKKINIVPRKVFLDGENGDSNPKEVGGGTPRIVRMVNDEDDDIEAIPEEAQERISAKEIRKKERAAKRAEKAARRAKREEEEEAAEDHGDEEGGRQHRSPQESAE